MSADRMWGCKLDSPADSIPQESTQRIKCWSFESKKLKGAAKNTGGQEFRWAFEPKSSAYNQTGLTRYEPTCSSVQVMLNVIHSNLQKNTIMFNAILHRWRGSYHGFYPMLYMWWKFHSRLSLTQAFKSLHIDFPLICPLKSAYTLMDSSI